MALELHVKVSRPVGVLWMISACPTIIVLLPENWNRGLNVAVMECYFLCKPMDEERKPLRGYRKRMHAIWKERYQLVVTE